MAIQYSKKVDLVFLEITGISQEGMSELERFCLRSNIMKIAGVGAFVNRARYSAVFTADHAREIEEWLTAQGVRQTRS